LNSENIDTPLVHRKKKGTHTSRGWTAKMEINRWTTANVGKILRDVRYAGTMVNGKRTQVAPLSKKSKPVPREEWIVVPDTHEGIVSMETYEAVQKLLPELGGAPRNLGNHSLFSKKIYCGHCGYALRRLRGKYYYFDCLTHVHTSSEWHITDRIYEYMVKDLVLVAFKKSVELALLAKDEMQGISKQNNAEQSNISEQLTKLSGKERRLTEQKVKLFEDLAGNIISKEQYLEAKTALTAEIEKIKEQKAELESKAQKYETVSETSYVIGLLEKLNKIQEVTPELVSFVKRITVYSGERIEIQFTFADELARVCAVTNTKMNEYTEVI
jgi:hypothetical protein